MIYILQHLCDLLFFLYPRAVVPSSERAGWPPPRTSRRTEGAKLGQVRVRDEAPACLLVSTSLGSGHPHSGDMVTSLIESHREPRMSKIFRSAGAGRIGACAPTGPGCPLGRPEPPYRPRLILPSRCRPGRKPPRTSVTRSTFFAGSSPKKCDLALGHFSEDPKAVDTEEESKRKKKVVGSGVVWAITAILSPSLPVLYIVMESTKMMENTLKLGIDPTP